MRRRHEWQSLYWRVSDLVNHLALSLNESRDGWRVMLVWLVRSISVTWNCQSDANIPRTSQLDTFLKQFGEFYKMMISTCQATTDIQKEFNRNMYLRETVKIMKWQLMDQICKFVCMFRTLGRNWFYDLWTKSEPITTIIIIRRQYVTGRELREAMSNLMLVYQKL